MTLCALGLSVNKMALRKSFYKNEVSCYRSKGCATVRGMDGSMVLLEVLFCLEE